MIQDIKPSVFNNHFENFKPEPEDIALYFVNDKLVCFYDKNNHTLNFPRVKVFASDKAVYLFSINKQKFFLMAEPPQTFEGYSLYDMKELRQLLLCSNKALFTAYTAYHLCQWYAANRFCGCCGKPTLHDSFERALVCSDCGAKSYPRINPAVIIGIINGDKILITKYKTGYVHNALVAGFTEIGESLEQTVEREVMEEVGLKVKNIRYYKSQPWGVAQDLLAGFFCEVEGDDKIQMDESELKYAQWVSRSQIELQPSDYSLTNEMMKMFRDGKISAL